MTAPTLYDSTNAGAIPVGAAAVGGYANGRYVWTPGDWARFPGASRVSIDVLNHPGAAGALDIEQGDASIDDAPGWVRGSLAAGWARVWLYIARDNWQALVDAIFNAGLDNAPVGYWVAHWTGKPHAETLGGVQAAAVQYADPANGSGGDFDLSAVFGPLPIRGAAPAPSTSSSTSGGPGPGPTTTGADVQIPTIRQGSTGGAVKAAQALLNAKGGARLTLDGVFGPATAQAVTNWQRELRLGADGIVGPQTWGALVDL